MNSDKSIEEQFALESFMVPTSEERNLEKSHVNRCWNYSALENGDTEREVYFCNCHLKANDSQISVTIISRKTDTYVLARFIHDGHSNYHHLAELVDAPKITQLMNNKSDT